MANQRMIYLSDEINNKLKNEENVSQLISKLLENHFNSISNPKEKLEEINIEVERKLREAEEIRKEINEIDLKKQEALAIEKEHELKYSPELRWDRIEELTKELINNYEVLEENKEQLLKEYMELLKENKIKNLIEFMTSKGIDRKNKKNIDKDIIEKTINI